jgi:biotin--protein ligase
MHLLNVLVYLDQGVSWFSARETVRSLERVLDPSLYTVKLVDHRYLTLQPWEDSTAALVVPGGRDLPYQERLGGGVNARIRSFVHTGGAYLGICAGAYYASSKIQFEMHTPLQMCVDRELAFFPGMAVGPALGTGVFSYVSEDGAEAPVIRWWNGHEFVSGSVYYNGGCWFQQPEAFPHVHVIGRYHTLQDTPAAIIHCQVGTGNVVLSGVHPEVGVESLQIARLLPQLQEDEPKRRWLWRAMLQKLKLCHEKGVLDEQ